jgi:hypothetical protein
MSDGAYADISVDRGADFTMQIVWTDPNNQPYEVVHPIRMQARSSTGQVVLDLTSEADEQTDPEEATVPPLTYSTEGGFIQVFIPYSTTEGLTPGTYYYDMFVTYNASVYSLTTGNTSTEVRRFKLIYGKLTVEGRVTENV